VPTGSAVVTRACRILYYGPGGAGKRENLKQIINSIPAEHRLESGEKDEQEIAFLLRNGDQGDWRVIVRAIDMGREPVPEPGTQPDLPFDGIVFTVNSVVARLDQSLSSFEALKAFLDAWGRDLMSVALVLQYNRREQADTLPVDRMESLLNPWGLLSFPASTVQQEGVKETLKAILGLSISQILLDEQDGGQAAQDGGQAARDGDQVGRDGGQVGRDSGQVGREGGPDFDSAPPVPGTDHTPDSARSSRGGQGDGNQGRVSGGGGGNRRGRRDLSALAEGRAALFDELRPPIVVPVRVPRKLLDKHGSVRILLEVQIDDSDPLLG